MTYTNTIQNIKELTGLKEPFIRKMFLELNDLFKPYVKRGNNNSLLFDSNAMMIWDKVKQLKEQNLSFDDIKNDLTKSILNETNKNQFQSEYNLEQTNLNDVVLKEVKTMYKELLLSKDETIKAKDMLIDSLNNKMLLLTGGKEPDVMLQEQRQKDIDIALLKKDLSHVENKFNDRSHELEHELSIYKKQIEKQQLQEQEKLKEQENIKAKQKSLIQELESLEGRFFVSKRKKEILKELQSINNI